MSDPTFFAPGIVERFMAKVEKTDACWMWSAGKTTAGYGQFYPKPRRGTYAHRWSYEYHIGPIPEGLHIDHLCRNRACVNPDHLEPVTQRTNTLRGASSAALRAAQTVCIHGHPFTPENTMIRKRGNGARHRQCRECNRISCMRRYRAKKARAE